MMDAGKQGQKSDMIFIEGSAAANWVPTFFFYDLRKLELCVFSVGQDQLLSSEENFQDAQYFKAIMEDE